MSLSLCLARAAAASPSSEPSTSGEPAGVIVLDDDLGPAARELLEQSLRELLARIDLRLASASLSSRAQVVARVSIELSPDAAVVSVSSLTDAGPPARYRVERTTDELFRETLAHVILSAVEPRAALLRQPTTAAEHPTPEPGAPPAQQPARGAAPIFDGRASWSLGARTGPLQLDADRVGATLGVSLVAALREPARPSATLEASYLVPVLLRVADVAAHLSRFGLRARARAEPLSSEHLALQLGLGGGLDVLGLTPQALPPGRSVGQRTRLQPLLGASLAGRLSVAEGCDLLAGLGLDVELTPRRWWIESDAGRQRFFETPRWLPYATLGIEWRFSPAHTELPP